MHHNITFLIINKKKVKTNRNNLQGREEAKDQELPREKEEKIVTHTLTLNHIQSPCLFYFGVKD